MKIYLSRPQDADYSILTQYHVNVEETKLKERKKQRRKMRTIKININL